MRQENIEANYQPWKVVQKIGQGSFGSVYEIKREEFGEIYRAALKVISIPQSEDEILANRADGMNEQSMTSYYESVVKDLTHEFSLLSRLKGYTNIVGYEDHKVVRHSDGIGWDIYIRMELLTSLKTISATHDFTQEEAIKVGLDICNALTLCKMKSIIHRDIKPDNIFISETGDFELGDFGIARTASRTMANMSRKGTPNYMAPEIYLNHPYNETADIYSLGIVLYQLMNHKRLPFIPEQLTLAAREEALVKRLSGAALPMPELASPDFSKIILKACAYEPADRYSSAEEMKQDLQVLLGNQDVRIDSSAFMSTKANGTYEQNNVVSDKIQSIEPDSNDTSRTQIIWTPKSSPLPIPSPEAPQTTPLLSSETPTYKKKRKKGVLFGICCSFIALLLVISSILLFCGKDELADKTLFDYTFKLDGQIYQLPCKLQEFTDAGWTREGIDWLSVSYGYSESSDQLEAAGFVSDYILEKAEQIIKVGVINDTENTLPLQSCKVYQISINDSDYENFILPGKINFDSTAEEIMEIFGKSTENNDDEICYSDEEQLDRILEQYYSIYIDYGVPMDSPGVTFFFRNGKMHMIEITSFPERLEKISFATE